MRSLLSAMNWQLCDEFSGAVGQRLKVRGTPAGNQGRSGLQWGGIQWPEEEGGYGETEDGRRLKLFLLFDVLHPQGFFLFCHVSSLYSDVWGWKQAGIYLNFKKTIIRIFIFTMDLVCELWQTQRILADYYHLTLQFPSALWCFIATLSSLVWFSGPQLLLFCFTVTALVISCLAAAGGLFQKQRSLAS